MKQRLRSFIKRVIPSSVKMFLKFLYKFFLYRIRYYILKFSVVYKSGVKIIVGAALTRQPGWYSTNEQWLDVRSSDDWFRLFKGKRVVDAVLAEHVFEHLTIDEMRCALRNIASYLTPNGTLRIAVPDGYNPNPEYIKHCGIKGLGADAADHKQLLNCDVLLNELKQAGFKCRLVEGYDAKHNLIFEPHDEERGIVLRSRSSKFDMSGKNGWNFVDSQTSLIVDGVIQLD